MKKLYLLLSILFIMSCNRWKDKVAYNGQELHRLVTMVSYYHCIDTLKAWKDTCSYFVNNAGEPVMVNGVPLFLKRKGKDSLEVIDYLTPQKGRVDTTFTHRIVSDGLVSEAPIGLIGIYKFSYDDEDRLIEATTYATDTYQYNLKWVGNLLTDVVIEGGYYSRAYITHVEYETTRNIPHSGLPALFDGGTDMLLRHFRSNAYLLTGYMGRIPNSPVKKITTQSKYGNLISEFNVKTKFDRHKRITSYSLVKPNGDVYIKRDFHYPN